MQLSEVNEERIRTLFDWWLSRQDERRPALAVSFQFDSGLVVMDRDEWLTMRHHSGALLAVEVLAVEAGPTGGSIVSEATDSVTGLRHRIAWLVTWSEDGFTRVLETHMTIHPEV